MNFDLKPKEGLCYYLAMQKGLIQFRRPFGLWSQSELDLYPVLLLSGFVTLEYCLTFVYFSLLISKIEK